VYGRKKLLELCKEGRDAFFEGKLNSSTALLIARIPDEEASAGSAEGDHGGRARRGSR
jgi:hypothetical protein